MSEPTHNKRGLRMEKIIVLVDDNGFELGAIYREKRSFILTDDAGEIVQKVSLKITVREAKEILLKRKLEADAETQPKSD